MDLDPEVLSTVTGSIDATIKNIGDRTLREQLSNLLDEFRIAIDKRINKIRKLAVTSIPKDTVDDLFKITPGSTKAHHAWDLKEDELKHVPEHLKLSLEAYNDGVKGAPPNEALVRVRINAVLLITLFTVKNDPTYQEIGPGLDYSKLHFQFETNMKLLWYDSAGKRVNISGAADYSLWQGGARPPQETNLFIVEAKANNGNGFEQCLSYMAMLLYSRRRAKRSDRTIWGISTDSNTWEFIRLNPDLTYTSRVYKIKQLDCIVTTLAQIFGQTAIISPTVSRSSQKESKKRPFTEGED